MKVEDFDPFWYNVLQKQQIPPRKDEVLMQNIVPLTCPKCNNTSLIYKYGKTKDGYKNISAVNATINLLLISLLLEKLPSTLAAPFAVSLLSFIMIMSITLTIVVLIKSAIIPFLSPKLLLYLQLLSLNFLVKPILNVSVILYI